MADKLTMEVTEADWDLAIEESDDEGCEDGTCCPIAQSLMRTYQLNDVFVGSPTRVSDYGDHRGIYDLDDDGEAVVGQFDSSPNHSRQNIRLPRTVTLTKQGEKT